MTYINKNIKQKATKLPFKKPNYQLMLLGILLIVFGYLIMALDKTPHGFGILGLTIGPIIVLGGYLIEFFAILYQPSSTKN